MSERDKRVEIPYGDDGILIDARPDQPRWIQAVKHDLHATHTDHQAFEPRPVATVLFIDHAPHLIVTPTRVRRDNGLPSVVRVTTYQSDTDARHHEITEEAA